MDALHELRNSKQSFMRVNRQRDSSARRKSRTVLSCIPCRQRKVKCDRLEPCSQCTRRSVAEACDYSPKTARAKSATPPIAESTQRGADIALSPSMTPVDGTLIIPPDVRPAPIPTCNHDLPASSRMGTVDSLTQSCFHGSATRTRYFGRSHWALTMDMFPDLKAHLQKYHHVKKGPVGHGSDNLGMKRTTQRRLEATYQTQPQPNLEPSRLETLVPDRQVTDKLVNLYFSTFETTFRILHVHQFQAEYEEFWSSGDNASPNIWSRDVFAAKLLSLMACAADAGITAEEHTPQASNQTAKGWIQAVGSWVKTVTAYAKLDLDFIQVMCLLLIARQAIAYEGDLAWLAAGSLLREAMMIGLHRDPIGFKSVSPFYAEIRRRLWATIVELDLQAALDTGVPAGISQDDYDCAPPSNLDDEDFSFNSTVIPASKPSAVLTRTSFQVSLAQTLETRLRIVKLVNQIRLSSNYQEILDLSQVITTHLSQTPLVITGQSPGEGLPSKFQQSLYLFLVYRYILALHRPFVLSLAETRNEMYRYSREICVKACLSLLSPLELAPESEARPVYPHILRLRGGMFRSEIFHAAATLCFELRLQVRDSTLPLLPGALDQTDQGSEKRDLLLRTVESAIKYFEHKVRTEKQACKAFMLLNMVYTSAQSELHSGTHNLHVNCGVMNDLTLENACPRAARRCQELLLEGEGRADCQHSEENWLGYPGNPFMNEEVPGVGADSQSTEINASSLEQSTNITATMPTGSSDPDLFDLSFDWGMYLDPTYLNEAGNLWPLMDPLI
ncbi:fungal-specific transcription factor domain-containing protein [Penicillium frequentans]|nr:fungal-specific transcription factor domain-containing protein [Penicillium glabrum]